MRCEQSRPLASVLQVTAELGPLPVHLSPASSFHPSSPSLVDSWPKVVLEDQALGSD